MQQGHTVAHVERAPHVVGDHQPGDAEVASAHDELVHQRGGDGVQPGRRLVVQNVARLEGDRPRDADPLPHSAGELGRSLSLLPLSSTTSRLSSIRSRIVRLVIAPPDQPHADVLGHGHRVEQRGKLEDVSDAAPQGRQLVAVQLCDIGLVHQHPARVGLEQAHDELQGDALPAPDAPMMTVFWPSGTSSVSPFRTARAPKDLARFRGYHPGPLPVSRIIEAPAPRTHRAPGSPRSRAPPRWSWTGRLPGPHPRSPAPQAAHQATAKPKLALLTRPNQMSLN